MEKREFKVGDKVKIPKTKSIGLKINNPLIENLIKKEKQDYLIVEYVANLYALEQRVSCMFPTSDASADFLNTDLEHYEEFPEKWAIELYPEVKKWIENEYQTNCYSENPKNNIFHFPNWRDGNGFLKHWHTNDKVEKGYTKITLEQFKKNFLKEEQMERKIVGYKLIKPEYEEAALKITGMINQYWTGFSNNKFLKTEKWSCNDYEKYVAKLKEAGVLDLWFEPIYEKEFKVGDWVTVTEIEGSGWLNYCSQRTFELKESPTNYCGGIYWGVNEGGLHAKFRKATPEEIEAAKAARKTIIKMHSSNKGEFEIEVVNGKAWYRPDNRELPKKWIKDIIDIFGEQGGINYPYKLEVKSVKVGCMEGTRREDWVKVYDLLK